MVRIYTFIILFAIQFQKVVRHFCLCILSALSRAHTNTHCMKWKQCLIIATSAKMHFQAMPNMEFRRLEIKIGHFSSEILWKNYEICMILWCRQFRQFFETFNIVTSLFWNLLFSIFLHLSLFYDSHFVRFTLLTFCGFKTPKNQFIKRISQTK